MTTKTTTTTTTTKTERSEQIKKALEEPQFDQNNDVVQEVMDAGIEHLMDNLSSENN